MLIQNDGSNNITFGYDNNGNTVAEGTNTYTYNGNDRMVAASVGGNALSYVYDGDNRRVSVTNGGVTTAHYYSLLGEVLEQRGGVDYAKYVRAPNGMPLAISGPDGVFYYLYDGSGNVVGMIRADGTADWYSYYAFGEDLNTQGSDYNPYRYAASYRDQESAGEYRYYMMARYQDPAYGRFSQVDPIGGASGYGYAANNPLAFGDPSGQDPIRWLKRVAKGFFGTSPGYVDVNFSVPAFYGVLGPTGGVQIGQEGFRIYGGGGIMTGPGAALTGSANSPSTGWQVAGQWGSPRSRGGQVGAACCFHDPFAEAGIVSPGFSLTAYYVSRPFGCFWCD